MVNRTIASCTAQLVMVCALMASAHAQTPEADAIARKALEQKQYSQVLAAYQAVPLDRLSDKSHYRMAIAFLRLGNFSAASDSLKAALKLNPSGSFASSPERVSALKTDIQKGLESEAVVLAVSAEPVVSIAVASTSVATQSASVPPLGSSTAATVSSPTVAPLEPVAAAPEPPARKTPVVLAVNEPVADGPVWVPMAGVGVALTALVGALYISHKRKNKIVSRMESLRDQVASFLNEMEGAGGNVPDVALYAPLSKLLPLLEREIGRSHYRRSGQLAALNSDDRQTAKLMDGLQKSPLRLATASPEQILRLFQADRLKA